MSKTRSMLLRLIRTALAISNFAIFLVFVGVFVQSSNAGEPLQTTLKTKAIDEDTVLVTAGFNYQRECTTSKPAKLSVSGSKGGKILATGTMGIQFDAGGNSGGAAALPMFVVRLEDATPIEEEGNNAYCLGSKWVFEKPGLSFTNGRYVYTSNRKGATVEFQRQGVLLKCVTFKPMATQK